MTGKERGDQAGIEAVADLRVEKSRSRTVSSSRSMRIGVAQSDIGDALMACAWIEDVLERAPAAFLPR